MYIWVASLVNFLHGHGKMSEYHHQSRVRLWHHIKALERRSSSHHATGLKDVPISYIAHGKDNTLLFGADKLPKMFPKDSLVRVKVCGGGGRGIKKIILSDAATLVRNGLDADMVLKQVANQELAIMEADICEFIWKQFALAKAMHACSLHPRACRIDVHVPSVVGVTGHSDTGIRLVPMRRFASNVASALRRWTDKEARERMAIQVARTMLESLRIIHAMQWVHLDIKPANILLPAHDGVDGATLTDYETMDRSEYVMERIDVNRDVAIYVGTVRYMSPVLSLKVSSLFRAACVAAGITPSHPSVHASRNAFDTPTVCDMHSLAMTLTEMAGAHTRTPSPKVARAIKKVLCAKSALECPDLV
jgi:serine/threonine protein kinase